MGPLIGVVLLCSAVVAGNGASAAVHKESHHDRTSTQTLRQDKRKLVQLKAELDRLDKSIQTTMTQIEAQAGQLGASSGVATTAEIEGQARQLAATAGSVTSAEDEVSKAIEQLFGSYGQEYQALSAETAAIHEEFVKALASGSSVPSTT